MLDSARYRTFIAWETKASVQDVHAQVLGGHTEATMVPIVSTAHVGGVPLTTLLTKKKIEACVQRAKNGGAEIVGLLKTGSAYYAPAAATVEMVEAVLLDKKRILPCAVLADGQYGIKGAYVGLPAEAGRRWHRGRLRAAALGGRDRRHPNRRGVDARAGGADRKAESRHEEVDAGGDAPHRRCLQYRIPALRRVQWNPEKRSSGHRSSST